MVATRRHWVHVQTVEEEKRKSKRRKKLGRVVLQPELKLTSADLMWSEKGRECEKLHNKWSKEEISQKNAQTAKNVASG